MIFESRGLAPALLREPVMKIDQRLANLEIRAFARSALQLADVWLATTGLLGDSTLGKTGAL
jgi:hypothetical protein